MGQYKQIKKDLHGYSSLLTSEVYSHSKYRPFKAHMTFTLMVNVALCVISDCTQTICFIIHVSYCFISVHQRLWWLIKTTKHNKTVPCLKSAQNSLLSQDKKTNWHELYSKVIQYLFAVRVWECVCAETGGLHSYVRVLFLQLVFSVHHGNNGLAQLDCRDTEDRVR